jgi:hypothetical protein
MGLRAVFIAGLVGAMFAEAAEAQELQQFHLDVRWTAPIAAIPTESDHSIDGTILLAQSTSSQRRTAFLADEVSAGHRSPVLFLDAGASSLGNRTGLPLKGAVRDGEGLVSRLISTIDRKPSLSAIAVGKSGDVWIGGLASPYLDWISSYHSDAYLAKLAPSGKLLWEKAYGNGGRQTIGSIASLENDDVAVAGRDYRDGRVARIGPDGTQLWERRLGNDLGGAIAALPGDRLAVIGFEAAGSPEGLDVPAGLVLWILDGSGKTLVQTPVREHFGLLNRHGLSQVSIIVADDAIYVGSIWKDDFAPQPAAVAKLGLEGQLLWRTSLTETITDVEWMGRRRAISCKPTYAAVRNFGLIAACTFGDLIQLFRFDSSTGAYQASTLPLPDCQKGIAGQLFLAPDGDDAMTLSSTRPAGYGAASCRWTGRLTAGP